MAQDTPEKPYELARLDIMAKVELVPAIVEFSRLVLETFPGICADAGKLYRLQLAVSEACTNVARHAYAQEDGRVELVIIVEAGGIRLEVSDWGASFDPYSLPDPDLDNPKGSGLGLFIIRQCADSIAYFKKDGRNTLSMGVYLDDDACKP